MWEREKKVWKFKIDEVIQFNGHIFREVRLVLTEKKSIKLSWL